MIHDQSLNDTRATTNSIQFIGMIPQGMITGFEIWILKVQICNFIFNPLVNPQVQQQPTSNKTLALIWVKERVDQPELCLSQQIQ